MLALKQLVEFLRLLTPRRFPSREHLFDLSRSGERTESFDLFDFIFVFFFDDFSASLADYARTAAIAACPDMAAPTSRWAW